MLQRVILAINEPKEKLIKAFWLQQKVDALINSVCVEYYKGKHPKHHLWTGHYQFILDNIENGATVLDVGCGASSSYTQKLAKKCKIIDCCDYKPDLVERSIKANQFSNVNFFICDITREVPTKNYDMVILSHVLEHLNDPVKVLENLQKITNKLIIRLPRYDDHWMYLVKKDIGLFYFKDADHKREYTLQDAIAEVEKAGWNVTTALNDIDIKIVAVRR